MQVSTHQESQWLYQWPTVLLILLLTTVVHCALIAHQSWPVNGDETQYWNWGQNLAWGYYSKPPVLAWLIATTTQLFGDNIFGLRLASPLCHAVTTGVIYLIGRELYQAKVGFWSSLTYCLLPGVSFSATIISTDAPLLMFWGLAFYAFLRAISTNSVIAWICCGLALGGALLSKYSAIFFVISALMFLIGSSSRYLLYQRGPYLSLVIAGLMLLPNLWWNYRYGFVSFLAVKDNADLHGILFHPSQLLNFIGSQAAIFGPILFSVFCLICMKFHKLISDERQRLLLFFVIPLLGTMILESLISRAHGNWAAPIYITAIIAIVSYLIQTQNIKWLKISFVFNLFLLIGLFYIQTIIHAVGVRLPTKTTIINWSEIGSKISELRSHYPGSYLLVDERMLLAQSMYYAHVPITETFKWNPNQEIKDHYDLVTHMYTKIGANFLLVTYQQKPQAILDRFNLAEVLPIINMQALDGRVITLYPFFLSGFRGYANNPGLT